MARLLGEHWENDVRVRWHDLGDGNIAVQRQQDAQAVLDQVAAVNSDGAKTLDGLGKPVAEVPLVAMIDWCHARGIPWEKMAYGNEYNAEFKQFLSDHSRLRYEARKVHPGL